MAERTGGSGRSYRGRGGLRTRVKTARKRSNSSTRWLARQLNDPYVENAKKQGWRSRSAFKLIEIDDKHQIFKPGNRVVDLGAAPGGWSQVAAMRLKSTDEAPLIVAVDYLDMDPIPGVRFLKKDFTDHDAPTVILEALGGMPDVILSDMAAPTTGHRKTDHLRTTHLFELAVEFAEQSLTPGGILLAKVFRGGTEAGLLAELRKRFDTVRHLKPPASRAESPELYVLAQGFKGTR